MQKANFYVIKLKRNFLPMLFLLFTFCLLIFSKTNLPAVKKGLSLWANSVVPSLFPFFVATEMLMHTNIVNQLGIIFNGIMKPLFNVNGRGAFAFVMGIISGYPVGAKIAVNFRKNNICSKEECERLLSFTNNSGPLFIIGTVGISMFGSTTIGVLLFITHLLASITVGIIFRFWKCKKNSTYVNLKQNAKKITQPQNQKNLANNLQNRRGNFNDVKSVNFSNLGEIIAESITNSTSTILMIGGFVVIFSSIISILKSSGICNLAVIFLSPLFDFFNIDTSFIQGLFTGFFEITNGINLISNIHIKKLSINIIFTAFLLGFGGISVLLQVLSIVSKTDLSKKPYIIGKILHGFISAFYTFIFMNIIPILNFDLQ